MNILVSAKMIPGNFEPKFYPLIAMDEVSKIYVVRKEEGPELDKIEYIVLPRICRIAVFNVLLTPFILAYQAWKKKAKFIISYHIMPHAFFACFASIFTNTPYIVGQTGGKIEQLSSRNGPVKKLVHFTLNRARFINVPGIPSKNVWVKQGIDPEKINILHSVIDTEKFKPEQQQKEYDFIFVGALIKRKRVDLIIDSFSKIIDKHPDAKLLIVGDGSERSNLVSQARKLGLMNNIHFYGYSREINKLLNTAKISVMASEVEGLPVAMMEAMSCELLVIAPDVFNISQAVEHEKTGYLLKNVTSDSLSELLDYTLVKYHSLEHIRKSARVKIQKEHSIDSAKTKWEKIFQSL